MQTIYLKGIPYRIFFLVSSYFGSRAYVSAGLGLARQAAVGKGVLHDDGLEASGEATVKSVVVNEYQHIGFGADWQAEIKNYHAV